MSFRPRTIVRLMLALSLGVLWGGTEEHPGRMAWREFGVEQGLRNLSVWAICQDRRGFLWVGTENGLHRYDGSRFAAFDSKDGLPSSQILTLQENPDGGIWVGTYRGLARWDGGRFVPVGADLPALTQPIQALALGPDGALRVGTTKGLFRQVRGDQFEAIASWTGGAVSALAVQASPGGLCAATWDGSRARVFQGGDSGWRELSGPAGFGRERLDALTVDRAGILWARSLGALWQFKEPTFQRAAFPVKETRQKATLLTGQRGQLWVPGDSELLTLGPEGVLREGSREGWPRRFVRTACMDREGSLWVGGEGLRRIKGRGLWRSYGPPEGLTNPYVWSIWRHPNRTLYAGTERGLARLGPAGWEVIPGTEDTQVRSIALGPDGALYLAGSPWIRRWDPRSGSTVKFGPETGVRANGRIFRLLFDRQGVLWVATDSGGLLRGRGQGTQWSFTPESLPEGTPQESIEDLHEDAAGRLWVPGMQGLAVHEGGQWRRFTSRDGLRKDAMAFARSLRNGDLLLAYFDNLGQARARYENGQFRVMNHFDVLLDPVRLTYLIGEDARDNLWIGSGRGVSMVTPTGQVEHFAYSDGLVFDNTNNMAFHADPNGDVWIGTTDGLARFDASRYDGPPRPPLLEVVSYQFGSKAFHGIPGEPLEVPFQSNTFEVAFAALSFIHEGDSSLEVRLDGLEQEWHSARGLTERYPGLAAGNYAFQARSRIGSGPWTSTQPVRFRVLPAWWNGWPFRTLMSLALAGGIIVYIRWRMRHLQALNTALENKVRERTLALDASEKRAWEAYSKLQTIGDQKNQFFGIVAHDLRNPLNGIVLAAQLLEEEHNLERLHATARKISKRGMEMSALIGRFLDVAALETGHVKPESSTFPMVAVATEVLELHRPQAEEKGIALGLDPGEGNAKVHADEKFTKAILDNLLSNAIKYSPPGTQTWLRLRIDGDTLVVSVEDQGPGLTEADQDNLFQRFVTLSATPTGGEKATGLGLSIVKHMADAMGCRIWVESQPGQGAAFHVAFPLAKS